MYYLKDIEGNRKAFSSMKDIFIFIEEEVLTDHRRKFSHSKLTLINLENIILRMVGDNFNSRLMDLNTGYQDKRNTECYIHNFSYFEENRWLATFNKYIIVDVAGRTLSSDTFKARYSHRFLDVHYTTSRWCGQVHFTQSGNKNSKRWNQRLNRLYADQSLCKDELLAMTSRDEFDIAHPIRKSRQSVLRSLNLQHDSNFVEDYRSWKTQSKKSKQWM